MRKRLAGIFRAFAFIISKSVARRTLLKPDRFFPMRFPTEREMAVVSNQNGPGRSSTNTKAGFLTGRNQSASTRNPDLGSGPAFPRAGEGAIEESPVEGSGSHIFFPLGGRNRPKGRKMTMRIVRKFYKTEWRAGWWGTEVFPHFPGADRDMREGGSCFSRKTLPGNRIRVERGGRKRRIENVFSLKAGTSR